MLLNYYTLLRLTDQWRTLLSGAKIIEAFSQVKDVLHVGLVTPSRQSYYLEVCLETHRPYVALRTQQSRKGRNSVDLFPGLIGQRMTGVTIDGFDRQIVMRLDSEETLNLRLYGTMNVFLIAPGGQIKDAFKEAKRLTDSVLESSPRDLSWNEEASFVRRFPTWSAFETALHEGLAGFNRTLSSELAWRMKDETYEPVRAYRYLRSFIGELESSGLRIYYRHDEPLLLSPVALSHLSVKYDGIREDVREDDNETLLTYVAARNAFEIRDRRRRDVIRSCRHRIRKQRNLLKRLQSELTDSLRYEEEEQKASLLTMNFNAISRGMTEIELADVYHDGTAIRVVLDPSLSPQENAARLYTRARKMKNAVANLQKRMNQIAADAERLQKIEQTLSDTGTTDWKEVERRYEEFRKLGWLQEETKDDKPSSRPTFREFRVNGDWRVFVGQNDEKNDQLTFQFAHKNDLWFHARGVPGSHVLLKRDGRKDNPSKRALEEAAAIAAFYSKSRTGSMVPVIMTERKYVRKRKGLRPGQVIVDREDVLVVDPMKPAPFASDSSDGSE